MRLISLEETYFLPVDVEEAQVRVQKALEEVGLKNVLVKKHVPPRYLLVEYSPGWVGKALEIEFLFRQIEGGTEVAVKWPYVRALAGKDESPSEFTQWQEETRVKAEQLISEFKRLIGATETV
jgi:hypothetical protein